MKIDRVTYQKIFPLDAYVNQKVGLESSVDEGEDPKMVLDKLKEIAESWNEESMDKYHFNAEYTEYSIPLPLSSKTNEMKTQIEDALSKALAMDDRNQIIEFIDSSNDYIKFALKFNPEIKKRLNKK